MIQHRSWGDLDYLLSVFRVSSSLCTVKASELQNYTFSANGNLLFWEKLQKTIGPGDKLEKGMVLQTESCAEHAEKVFHIFSFSTRSRIQRCFMSKISSTGRASFSTSR